MDPALFLPHAKALPHELAVLFTEAPTLPLPIVDTECALLHFSAKYIRSLPADKACGFVPFLPAPEAMNVFRSDPRVSVRRCVSLNPHLPTSDADVLLQWALSTQLQSPDCLENLASLVSIEALLSFYDRLKGPAASKRLANISTSNVASALAAVDFSGLPGFTKALLFLLELSDDSTHLPTPSSAVTGLSESDASLISDLFFEAFSVKGEFSSHMFHVLQRYPQSIQSDVRAAFPRSGVPFSSTLLSELADPSDALIEFTLSVGPWEAVQLLPQDVFSRALPHILDRAVEALSPLRLVNFSLQQFSRHRNLLYPGWGRLVGFVDACLVLQRWDALEVLLWAFDSATADTVADYLAMNQFSVTKLPANVRDVFSNRLTSPRLLHLLCGVPVDDPGFKHRFQVAAQISPQSFSHADLRWLLENVHLGPAAASLLLCSRDDIRSWAQSHFPANVPDADCVTCLAQHPNALSRVGRFGAHTLLKNVATPPHATVLLLEYTLTFSRWLAGNYPLHAWDVEIFDKVLHSFSNSQASGFEVLHILQSSLNTPHIAKGLLRSRGFLRLCTLFDVTDSLEFSGLVQFIFSFLFDSFQDSPGPWRVAVELLPSWPGSLAELASVCLAAGE